MSEPFLSQIMMVSFNFAPRGWAQCDGQLLPINQNQSLYSLLGTTYGGDGRTTFALPDLRGRAPMHRGDYFPLGEKGGQETVALTIAQIPEHTHAFQASAADATASSPQNALPAKPSRVAYNVEDSLVDMNSGVVMPIGGGVGHNNLQPFLAINFVIALQGLFPSRN